MSRNVTSATTRLGLPLRRLSAEPRRTEAMDRPGRPAAPGAITLDMLRPLVRAKGLDWGRDALARYNVGGFAKMSRKQRTALLAELTSVAAINPT